MRATNAQFEVTDILHRLDVRMLDLSPGDQGWDVFSLHYHVDGPISTVMTFDLSIGARIQIMIRFRSQGDVVLVL